MCVLRTNTSFSHYPASPSISRTSTFSAQERVQQLYNHLSRSNTMERHNTAQEAEREPSAPAVAPQPQDSNSQDPKKEPNPKCKYCKRPRACPTCNMILAPETEKKESSDLDRDVPDIYNQLPPPVHDLALDSHPDFVHCLPPVPPTYREFSVFAAGSIEMGDAIQWQKLLANYLCNLPLTLNNPRRGRWEKHITQQAEDKAFREQVEWELDALTKSTVICFFFDHATMSPVTMCELGLWVHSGKVVVCCDRKFWKGGNVELVCERYGVPLVDTFAQLVPLVKAKLRTKGFILDGEGNVTADEGRADPGRNMGLEEAVEYCKVRTPARWGMEVDLETQLAEKK